MSCYWKDDDSLKNDLESYVKRRYKRKELLDFVEKNYSQYTWSMRTLGRRLRYFNIKYIDYTIPLEDIRAAVQTELHGPGKCLGYRALTQKIRQIANLNVPRDMVHNMMYDIDPVAVENRRPGVRKKAAKGHFISKGPNWFHSMDGHDKLMGYQNSTYPLAVYGCIDTCSRKILWLRIWTTNSNPKVIGNFYLQHLHETKILPSNIRIDHGTETVDMAGVHAYLREATGSEDPCSTVRYGPSTSNQIERWWRELHERLEHYFKQGLEQLKNNGEYEPHNDRHRSLLAFVLIPILQKELDIFRTTVWNTDRIRSQKESFLPAGVPDHIYEFPQRYDLEDCGHQLTDEQLEEVMVASELFDAPDDYLSADERHEFRQHLPQPEEIHPNEFTEAYNFLRNCVGA